MRMAVARAPDLVTRERQHYRPNDHEVGYHGRISRARQYPGRDDEPDPENHVDPLLDHVVGEEGECAQNRDYDADDNRAAGGGGIVIGEIKDPRRYDKPEAQDHVEPI